MVTIILNNAYINWLLKTYKHIAVAFALCCAFSAKGQIGSDAKVFDTIPRLETFEPDLSLLDKIRCVAYLTSKNFVVQDSLETLYVSLYYDDPYLYLHKPEFDAKCEFIFNISYLFALHERIDFFMNRYKGFVVNIYNGDRLFWTKDFVIQPHSIKENTIGMMSSFVTYLRLPATWNIVDHRFEIYFHCVDYKNYPDFHKPLLLVLHKTGFLKKEWKEWRGIYQKCVLDEAPYECKVQLP